MVHTQTEARQFFVDKVTEGARAEGVELSDDERQMLFWSESESESVADPALVERLAAHISDADYEAKIGGLLRRSLKDEIAHDPEAKRRWQQAWSVLKRGDYYILIMIDQAVGRQLTPWWKLRW